MVQFESPRHWNPSVSFNFGVGRIPFSDNWPSGVIRMGSPVWKCKSWKIFRTKVTQLAQFECPRHWSPSVSSISWVGRIPFSDYWPSGVIRMGSPVWKCKSWKIFRTKVTQQDANGPVWMPQALKPLCLIHFWSWVNSLFRLLALWGNKNGLPSMKVPKLKIYENKSDSTGCKWPRLNATGL